MAKKEKVEVKTKELFYRGVKLDELKKLSAREIAKYLPARARRSVLRKFDVIEKFVKRCEKSIAEKKKIRTHLRDMVIMPQLVDMTIAVHGGKSFNDVLITHEMIGHRLGEFALTRKKVVHGEAGLGATKSSRAEKK